MKKKTQNSTANFYKKNKGITLIALVITIIVLLILAGVSIATLTGDNGLLTRTNDSKEISERAEVEERVKLILAEWELAKKEPNNTLTLEEFLNLKVTSKELDKVTKNADGSFTLELEGYKAIVSKEGKMVGDIIDPDGETPPPSTGSFNGKVNTPMLSKGMIPIKHNGTNWVVCSQDDIEWFEYIDQLSGTDQKSRWANVMLSDGTYKEGAVKVGQIVQENELGSMYVWIPRYAYAITSNWHTNSAGIIKIAFLEGTKEYKVGDSVKYTYQGTEETGTIKNVSGEGNLNEHPAFNYGETAISGIWVSKFEASSETPSATNGGDNVTNLKIKSLPNVPSWRNITVSNIYTNCINMNNSTNAIYYGIETDDTKMDPHMMKNSEWGAIAYLTQSSYGRNGNEIQINNNSNCITGISGGSTNASQSTSTANSYTTTLGQKASTTGNISGVYDISGGAYEYVAGYVNNGNGNLQTYGSSLINSSIAAHKDIYTTTSDSQSNNYNQMSGRYGDAVYETSNTYSSSTGSWFGDYAICPYSSSPFFIRGGVCGYDSSAGAFYFYYTSGDAYSNCSFRSVLVAIPPPLLA